MPTGRTGSDRRRSIRASGRWRDGVRRRRSSGTCCTSSPRDRAGRSRALLARPLCRRPRQRCHTHRRAAPTRARTPRHLRSPACGRKRARRLEAIGRRSRRIDPSRADPQAAHHVGREAARHPARTVHRSRSRGRPIARSSRARAATCRVAVPARRRSWSSQGSGSPGRAAHECCRSAHPEAPEHLNRQQALVRRAEQPTHDRSPLRRWVRAPQQRERASRTRPSSVGPIGGRIDRSSGTASAPARLS